MDPQHRLFLECAWEALEDAGYDPRRLDGRIGVFGGRGAPTPTWCQPGAQREQLERMADPRAAQPGQRRALPRHARRRTSSTCAAPASRSQTACSTSLVAVHLACQSLLDRRVRHGARGRRRPSTCRSGGYLYVEGGILSPDGHCRAFDAKAQGTVFGSGAGVVVLQAAGRMRWPTATPSTRSSGARPSTTTAPLQGRLHRAQRRRPGRRHLASALGSAAVVGRETIGYVEAHGTGTALGDPIEVQALTQAFGDDGGRDGASAPSARSRRNIGHLDAAAGVAGLIKTVLALEHRQAAAQPPLRDAQPAASTSTRARSTSTRSCATWPARAETPRRAGVSSLRHRRHQRARGAGGGAGPPARPAPSAARASCWCCRRGAPAALDAATGLAAHLEAHPASRRWTRGRGLHAPGGPPGRYLHRRAVVCRDRRTRSRPLGDAEPAASPPAEEHTGRPPPWPSCSPARARSTRAWRADLYATEPGFRADVDAARTWLMPHLGLDLRDGPLPRRDPGRAKPRRQLRRRALAQPALFAVEYALARLWMSWGVRPERDDRPQHRRVRGRVPRGRVHAGRRAGAGGRARPADAGRCRRAPCCPSRCRKRSWCSPLDRAAVRGRGERAVHDGGRRARQTPWTR